MPAPIACPLRQHLWRLYRQGGKPARLADHLHLHPRCVYRVLQRFEHRGGTAPSQRCRVRTLGNDRLGWRSWYPPRTYPAPQVGCSKARPSRSARTDAASAPTRGGR